jgi:cobalamin biosynthetic protein CobC
MAEAEIGQAANTIIDESFCDTCPEASLAVHAPTQGVVVLKSFGKFWGLAGLRLGAMIAAPEMCRRMAEALGPWPVSGPALEIGARALEDRAWAETTRQRLARTRRGWTR